MRKQPLVCGFDQTLQTSFSIGGVSGSDIDGYRLTVSRHWDPTSPNPRRHRKDGRSSFPAPGHLIQTIIKKTFKTREESDQWALDHGYLQVYYKRTWCRKHRALHFFLSNPSPTFHHETCDRTNTWNTKAQARATVVALDLKKRIESNRRSRSHA